MKIKLLIVSGSNQADGRVLHMAHRARTLALALASEAEVRLLDLAETSLPLFSVEDQNGDRTQAVTRVREGAAWADAFLIGTPEYHGSMSGTLKNWFDFLYEELAGKLAGVYSVAGGMGGDMSIMAVKTSFQWCHGFTLPFHVAAGRDDFVGETLGSTAVIDRLERIVNDLLRYAPPLRASYAAALAEGEGTVAGFAGLHR